MITSDIIVVGCGLYGLTTADLCARELGLSVTLIDRRPSLGGNAASSVDPSTGIEVHDYGSHLFHTSNERVWEYVRRFTGFNNYTHRVYSTHKNEVYAFPINLGTINQFYRSALSPTEARLLIARECGGKDTHPSDDFETKAIGLVGRPLYDAFIRDYTNKQWQTDPKKLPGSVINRLPVRYTYDNRYFTDKYEGLPLNGYAAWFERMIDHPKIDVRLNLDFFDLSQPLNRSAVVSQIPVVYTGPLDRYFGFRFGPLQWRTLDFETDVIESGDYQGTSVMNYPDLDVSFTRIHEFRHLHPERNYTQDLTVIMREFSRFAGPTDEPYYPINSTTDRDRLGLYRIEAAKEIGVHFGGRLGTYQYLDMHMAIASAITNFESSIRPHFVTTKES